MRLLDVRHDPDPLPRRADVGPGSAYAAVATAVDVEPTATTLTAAGIAGDREVTELRDWRFRPSTDDEPRPVAVPHVWSRSEPDLVDFRGPCWYTRMIHTPADRHSRIVFAGLDYVASVHANGVLLGSHEGGFTPAAFDLPHGDVEVEVRVDDQPEEGMLGPKPLTAAKRKVKGVFEFHDSRPGGHALGLWFRPVWAVRWGTGGMVEPARLVRTGDVRIDATFVTAVNGRTRISWVVTNLGSDDVDAVLRSQVNEEGLEVRATLPPGASRVSIEASTADEVLWEPVRGPGHRTHLYELRTEVSVDGRVSDTDRTRFGVREIHMRLVPDDQFKLHVNGRRIYVRAANYIPGVWLPEMPEAVFRADLELAAEANLNSFGPHANVLPDRFYDAADEAGMLVYQDFPLNLGTDPDGAPLFDGGPTMAEASILLAAEATYHLYNHPSVVYWCGHNEPGYQLAEAFAGATHPDLVQIQQDLAALPDDEWLDDRRVQQWNHIDPTRPALGASGLGRTRPVGDNHGYSGSLSTDPTSTMSRTSVPFQSEYGAWTPNLSAAERAPGARGDWPPHVSTVADWEDSTHIYFPCAMRAGRPERHPDFQTWAYAAQLNGGMFLKLATEGMRRRKWDPTAANRYHLWVDHYGDAGAGVVDRHRTRQPIYWALADANRPLLPVVECLRSMRTIPGQELTLGTWVVNDTEESRTFELSWSVCVLDDHERFIVGVDDPQIPHRFGDPTPPKGDLVVLPRARGERVVSGAVDLEVAADESIPGPSVEFTPPVSNEPVAYAIWLDLTAPDGRTVRNWNAFVAAPADWEADPGITPLPRYALTITGDDRWRLDRRWTATTVASGDGASEITGLPPDQYVLRTTRGNLPIDLFGDAVVDPGSGHAHAETHLPWPFRALGRWAPR